MTRANAVGRYVPVRRKIDSLAREYRDAGYEVIVEPRNNELPEFLRGFEPDLLAKKLGDNIVVAVVAGGKGHKHGRIAELSELLSHRKDWRFLLVRLGSKTLRAYEMSAKGPLNWKEIEAVAGVARRLLEQQDHRAAILVAWAAFEAASRRVLTGDEQVPADAGPGEVTTLLYTEGLLNRQQYDRLQRLIDVRNATAHGYASRKPNNSELEFLLQLIQGLREMDSEARIAADTRRKKQAP